MMKSRLIIIGLAMSASVAWANGADHAGAVTPVLLALIVILTGAKLGGALAILLGQPAVLGELLAGVLLGNAAFAGIDWFAAIPESATIQALAQLGVIILLFEVGLESTVRDMLKVGLSSLLVATLGVIAPFVLGAGASAWLLPSHGWPVHVFIGATLTATSVGITARVLQDLGRSKSPEARVILGAAVIDDVLGLVILAVVTGAITAANAGAAQSASAILLMVGKAAGFLVAALALGTWMSPHVFRLASRLQGGGMLLPTALAFCFTLAWLAAQAGLAPIIGAYAAGLILEDVHILGFRRQGEQTLEDLVHPVSTLLTPVFFVLMGMQVNLRAFARPEALSLAAALIIAAVLGKQVCAFGALGMKVNRLAVGIGMIPRGEVGLIFAGIGMGLTLHGRRVIDETIYSAVVLMVIATTMITPAALAWAFRRGPTSTTRRRQATVD